MSRDTVDAHPSLIVGSSSADRGWLRSFRELNRPGFDGGSGVPWDSRSRITGDGSKGYSAEFGRRVVDLVESGKRVTEVAPDLDISEQTIYNWRHQDRVD